MTFSYINEYLVENNNGMIWDEELVKRTQDPKCIEKYGFKVYSQNDEDGIIEEIFNRIGTTNKKFIEFGVQDGIESNGHYLLLKDWKGFWIECDSDAVAQINYKFSDVIKSKQLVVATEYITKGNINEIFVKYNQTGQIDLLSIDIDGNDYHVWNEIEVVNPRVVVIEYNAKLPPSCEWIMPYCEEHRWDGGDKHGASLAALEKLGVKKGYVLVGTNISGVNAFFVREDCVQDYFAKKSVRELYNPPRYYKKYYSGHPSRYCIAGLPEGRRQLFCGVAENILFREGFYPRENSESNMHWMSSKNATLWIKDDEKKLKKLELWIDNPVIKAEHQNVPKKLSYRIEDGEMICKNLTQEQELIEIEIDRTLCKEDGVIEIGIKVDNTWCPIELGLSKDSRKLGVLVKDVKYY